MLPTSPSSLGTYIIRGDGNRNSTLGRAPLFWVSSFRRMPDAGCGRRYYITMIVFEATRALLLFWFPHNCQHTMANVIKNLTGLRPMMQHVRSHNAAASCICVGSVSHFLLRHCGQWCDRCSILESLMAATTTLTPTCLDHRLSSACCRAT